MHIPKLARLGFFILKNRYRQKITVTISRTASNGTHW